MNGVTGGILALWFQYTWRNTFLKDSLLSLRKSCECDDTHGALPGDVSDSRNRKWHGSSGLLCLYSCKCNSLWIKGALNYTTLCLVSQVSSLAEWRMSWAQVLKGISHLFTDGSSNIATIAWGRKPITTSEWSLDDIPEGKAHYDLNLCRSIHRGQRICTTVVGVTKQVWSIYWIGADDIHVVKCEDFEDWYYL